MNQLASLSFPGQLTGDALNLSDNPLTNFFFRRVDQFDLAHHRRHRTHQPHFAVQLDQIDEPCCEDNDLNHFELSSNLTSLVSLDLRLQRFDFPFPAA